MRCWPSPLESEGDSGAELGRRRGGKTDLVHVREVHRSGSSFATDSPVVRSARFHSPPCVPLDPKSPHIVPERTQRRRELRGMENVRGKGRLGFNVGRVLFSGARTGERGGIRAVPDPD